MLSPPGLSRRPQDNTLNCRDILRYLPVNGSETERFIANLKADQTLMRHVNAKYRPVFVPSTKPSVPGHYKCNNCDKILDCPLSYGFHKCKGPLITMHGAAGRQCKFCPAGFCKAVHKCPSVGLSCYTYDLSLDVTHCDADVRAVEQLQAQAGAQAEAGGDGDEDGATAKEAVSDARTRAATAWDRFVHPNDLDLQAIVASLQLRRFGGRHVVVSRFTTDDGLSQSATVTVHLGPSAIVLPCGTRLTGMKVLQADDEELPEGFAVLLYGGVPGGPPEKHDLVRELTRWGDLKLVLFKPLGLAIMLTGDAQDGQYVDPRWIGNLGVTLNHSCEPNTEASHLRIHGKSVTLLRLMTAVRGSDTELCWDYASTCESLDEEIDCLCGAGKCRGKLCKFQKSEETLRAEREAKRARFLVRPPHARESARVRGRMMATGREAERVAVGVFLG